MGARGDRARFIARARQSSSQLSAVPLCRDALTLSAIPGQGVAGGAEVWPQVDPSVMRGPRALAGL